MFDIHHENPVKLIEQQYQTVFGNNLEKYEIMKDTTSTAETAYFTSKTTSIGKKIGYFMDL